nr:WD repeat-containing protein 86-like [Ciona intestinalis]|eukprot:XP_026691642.1 WD repeat-containing protein 86-like [Ciona intestinalis]
MPEQSAYDIQPWVFNCCTVKSSPGEVGHWEVIPAVSTVWIYQHRKYFFLTGSDDRTARIWNINTYECTVVLEGHSGYISCCKMWENQFALTGSFDKTIRKWNPVSGNCVMKLDGHSGTVNRLLVQDENLFTTSYDSLVMCWNLRSGEVCHVFKGHSKSVLPICYVHGSQLESGNDNSVGGIVTGSMDNTARMWDVGSGSQLRSFRGHKGAVLCLVVDAEKKLLFTGSSDNTIRKWNLSSGEILKTFKGHEGSVICLQLSNRLLYSASVDSTARCWVAEFGDTTRKYVGHEHMISDMKYQRGIVFTASGDSCVRAFDSKSGHLKRTYRGHKYLVNCLMTLEDTLLSGSYDGSIKIWNTKDLLKDHVTEDMSSPGNSVASLRNRNDSIDTPATANTEPREVDSNTDNLMLEDSVMSKIKSKVNNERDHGARKETSYRKTRRNRNARVVPTNESESNINNNNNNFDDMLKPTSNEESTEAYAIPSSSQSSRPDKLWSNSPRRSLPQSSQGNRSELSHVDEQNHMIGAETSSGTSGYRSSESLASSPITSHNDEVLTRFKSKKKGSVSFSPSLSMTSGTIHDWQFDYQSPTSPIKAQNKQSKNTRTENERKQLEREILDMV